MGSGLNIYDNKSAAGMHDIRHANFSINAYLHDIDRKLCFKIKAKPRTITDYPPNHPFHMWTHLQSLKTIRV